MPLAFLLDHEGLKAVAGEWIGRILGQQAKDGWLGPRNGEGDDWPECDPWIQVPLLKALIRYQEVTGDGRVIPAMTKVLRGLDTRLTDSGPPSVAGRERWAALALSTHWLYERLGKGWLLDLVEKARQWGYDWTSHFANFAFTSKLRPEECCSAAQFVNNAMGIKQPGVWYRQSHDPGKELPRADWQVYPTTPWNHALSIDTDCAEKSVRFELRPPGQYPYSPQGAPIRASVKGRRVPGWQIDRNAAGPPPPSPVVSTEPLDDLTLIPYGCTNLRVTEFPLLMSEG